MSTATLVAIGAVVAIVVGASMEPWARLLHGRVWHHRLWSVHRSHHTRRVGRFEANDWLSALHAPIAAALVMIGCNMHGIAAAVAIGAGAGMTAFGLAYVLVHDGLVHGRLPVAFLARSRWLRQMRKAHAVHHARGGAPFGLFLGPRELTRASRKQDGHPSAPHRPVPAPGAPRDRRRDGARPCA